MIINWETGDAPSARVIDAKGDEWHDLTWIDTETGEGEKFVRKDNGSLAVKDGEVARLAIKLLVPIKVTRLDSDNLQLELPDERDRAGRALQELFSLTSRRGGIKLPGDEKKERQRKKVIELSDLLLGPGVEYWEYT